ncbi:Aste57867_21521 [Aphanomyces stellatus]|uniref:Kinesin-like protein n=1 Tax=Aphanomyces stellatus TaxID=120398 RepID=A0A485LIF5_9STRA|nr:hypothetical protein As57867_021452 [Aphanomyces stellatus]VFT98191.1 Aste57867_21521 [Aphanomyces stellatus]
MHVAVRLRPRLATEANEVEAVVASRDGRVQLMCTPKAARRPTAYKFDKVFSPDDSNLIVYETFLRPIVQSVLAGTHATVLAYGQTGTGKTFTMLGRDFWSELDTSTASSDDRAKQRGLMYFVAAELLGAGRGPVTCSYLELYNEKVFDLLRPDKTPLDVREDAIHGVFLPDLQVLPLASVETLTDILWRGAQTRACRATNMNERSSRSHTIMQLHVDSRTGCETATINLVDLAGSEKCKKSSTGVRPTPHGRAQLNAGQDMKELKFINQSLSTLGQCITALIRREKADDAASVHVPYRNSKLTRLLQPSLGGGGLCSFIVTLNPCKSSAQETFSTLQFATRAMKVSVSCAPEPTTPRTTALSPGKLTQQASEYRAMDAIMTELRAENRKLQRALDAERLQKRKLLLGFTSLLGASDENEKREATMSTKADDQGGDDVLAKLSSMELAIQSQLEGIQATKQALTSVISRHDDRTNDERTTTTPIVSNTPSRSLWDEYVDDATGYKYYHNTRTGVTRWTKPDE